MNILTYLTHQKYGTSKDWYNCEVIIFLAQCKSRSKKFTRTTGSCRKTNICKTPRNSCSCVENLPIDEETATHQTTLRFKISTQTFTYPRSEKWQVKNRQIAMYKKLSSWSSLGEPVCRCTIRILRLVTISYCHYNEYDEEDYFF